MFEQSSRVSRSPRSYEFGEQQRTVDLTTEVVNMKIQGEAAHSVRQFATIPYPSAALKFLPRMNLFHPFHCCRLLVLMLAAGISAQAGSPCSSPEKVRQIEATMRTLKPEQPDARDQVDTLMAVVDSPECSSVLRQRAGMLLGRIGAPAARAVPSLARLLDGPDRYWAMKSLGLFGETAAAVVERLSTELRDSDREFEDRILIADVLGQIRTGPAIEAIGRELLRGRTRKPKESLESRLLTETMLDAIALSGPQAVGALPALLRSLEHPDSDIRRKACQAIGRLGSRADPAIDSILERLALDEASEVQDAAAEALGLLGSGAVPVLLRVLRDAPPDLQWRAARSLGRSGEVWLGPGRLDPRRSLGSFQVKVAQALTAQFDSDDPRVRIESLTASWRVERRSEVVAAPLLRELSSPVRGNRQAATRLLIALPELPESVDTQLEELKAGDSVASRPAVEILRKRSLRD